MGNREDLSTPEKAMAFAVRWGVAPYWVIDHVVWRRVVTEVGPLAPSGTTHRWLWTELTKALQVTDASRAYEVQEDIKSHLRAQGRPTGKPIVTDGFGLHGEPKSRPTSFPTGQGQVWRRRWRSKTLQRLVKLFEAGEGPLPSFLSHEEWEQFWWWKPEDYFERDLETR